MKSLYRPLTAASSKLVASTPHKLRKYAWRALWVPYATLSLIPISFSTVAAYKWCVGDREGFRGTAFYALTGWLCLPLSLPVLFGAPFVLAFDPDQRTLMDRIQKLWGRSTTRPFFHTNVVGAGVLEDLGPAVYVSNHQSWLDIYALFWIDALQLKIVAKKEIMMIPVIGWVMSVIGHIPFDRKTGGKKLLEDCGYMLEKGTDVFFFPEGTRTKDGKLQDFKLGAFVLAERHQVPVVPITILNTGEMMPRGKEFWGTPMLREGEVTIIIHPPVMPTKMNVGKEHRKTAKEICTEVHEVIDSKLLSKVIKS
jgi:1-acyl-sn-glycerol-3-phosphate acyltransferase